MKEIQPNNVLRGTSSMLPYIPIPSTVGAEITYFGTAYPLRFALLTDVTIATPAGAEVPWSPEGRNLHAVQIIGTGVGSVTIEGTLDGENWAIVQTIAVATSGAGGITQFSGIYQSLRAYVDAITSGGFTVVARCQRT
jgi:hypothetical protein